MNGSVSFEGCTHATHVSCAVISGCEIQTLKSVSALNLYCRLSMASSSATSGVPTAPRPKPSQALVDPDVVELPAATSPVDYSPVVTPDVTTSPQE
eukprot:4171529-Amphidinium_carterae.1